MSRGLAVADYDEDGDRDVLITNAEGPARLFRNDFARRGGPLRVTALDAAGRAAFPTRITATLSDGREIVRRADPGGSYLAANDPRAFFAVPEGERVTKLLALWPDGSREEFPGADGPAVTLRRGEGTPR